MRHLTLLVLIFMLNFAYSQENEENIPISIPPPPPPNIEFISENDFLLFSEIITLNKDYLDGYNSVYILKEKVLIDSIDLVEIRKNMDIKKKVFCNIDTIKLSNVEYFYRNLFGYRKLESAKVFKDSVVLQYIKFGDDSIPAEKTFFMYNLNLQLKSERTYNYWYFSPDSVEVKSVEYEYKTSILHKKTTTNYNPRVKNKNLFENYYDNDGNVIKSIHESYNEENELNFRYSNTYEFDKKGRIIFIKSIGLKDEEIYINYENNNLIITYLMANNKKIKHTNFKLK